MVETESPKRKKKKRDTEQFSPESFSDAEESILSVHPMDANSPDREKGESGVDHFWHEIIEYTNKDIELD